MSDISKIEYASVLYRENLYGEFNKEENVHISAIYENFGSNKYIKPADENDYDPQYRYFIRVILHGA